MTCRAVTFDFNGTLSDDEEILFGVYAGLFAEHERRLADARHLAAEDPVGGEVDVAKLQQIGLLQDRFAGGVADEDLARPARKQPGDGLHLGACLRQRREVIEKA